MDLILRGTSTFIEASIVIPNKILKMNLLRVLFVKFFNIFYLKKKRYLPSKQKLQYYKHGVGSSLIRTIQIRQMYEIILKVHRS